MRALLGGTSGTTTIEEKIVIRASADGDGNLRVPTFGFGTNGSTGCSYNWKISVDCGSNATYSGIGGANLLVGYGLKVQSVHTIKITPTTEGYFWARAFGYYNSGVETTLMNIIYDQTYMGFAVSDVFTGDYYRYQQYYGCVNLKSTDSENIPSTTKIIGDYYRTSQYRGCTSLTFNAEEGDFNNVVKVGDYYRSGQYRECTNLANIKIKANNSVSTGSWYRQDQFADGGNVASPLTLTILGEGVECGTTNSLGLSDDNVKRVKICSQSIDDYKASTLWSNITDSKFIADTDQSGSDYEFILIKMKTDSDGTLKLPTYGYSTSGTKDCAYNRNVSVNGETINVSGTGGSDITIKTGLTTSTEYNVIIKPSTIAYGWGRAFGFDGSSLLSLITSYEHDSYKAYASSLTSTGDYYKYDQFTGCSNLTKYYEKLPTSCTSIGTRYMASALWNTGVIEGEKEVIHASTVIGTYYRQYMFNYCSNLTKHNGIVPTSYTSTTGYRSNMMGNVANANIYIVGYENINISLGSTNNVYTYLSNIYDYTHSSNWSTITASNFKSWYMPYTPYTYYNIDTFSLKYTITLPSDTSSSIEFYPQGGAVKVGNYIYSQTYRSTSTSTSSGEALSIYSYSGKVDGTASFVVKSTQVIGSGYRSIQGLFYNRGHMVIRAHHVKNNDAFESYNVKLTSIVETSSFYNTYDDSGNTGYVGFGISNDGCLFYHGYKNVDRDIDAMYLARLDPAFDLAGGSSTSLGFKGCDIRFSDDGLKMYVNSSGTITEYTLNSPFDIGKGYTSTGRTLSVDGSYFNFSDDGKEMYVSNGGGTLYVYGI